MIDLIMAILVVFTTAQPVINSAVPNQVFEVDVSRKYDVFGSTLFWTGVSSDMTC